MPPPYKNRETVGRCIYCNSSEEGLTDEHVYPYSLNGEFVLSCATCKSCQEVTQRIENEISRKFLLPLRTKRKYKTYNKKKRPASFILKSGKSKIDAVDVAVPASEFPALICLPVLRPATILTGDAPSNDAGAIDFVCCVDITGISQTVGEAGRKFFSVKNTFSVDFFMRFVAKVAQGGLVTALGLDGYASFLPDLILGKSTKFFHVIGCAEKDGSYQAKKRTTITVNFRPVPNEREYFIIVGIKNLFHTRSCPTYEVVAGRCDAEAFDGAPMKSWNRQVTCQRKLNYSKPIPDYFEVRYVFGTAILVIKKTDGKSVFFEESSLNVTTFSVERLPSR